MKIRFLEVNDWEALYINENLIMEGHSLNTREVLGAVLDAIDEPSFSYDLKRTFLDGELEEYGNTCPLHWLPELEEKAE